MFESKQFDELTKKLFSILPSNLNNLEQDIQKKFKEILEIAFSRLDLVTREEFDVQRKVLARTREKLESLERQVSSLMDEKKPND